MKIYIFSSNNDKMKISKFYLIRKQHRITIMKNIRIISIIMIRGSPINRFEIEIDKNWAKVIINYENLKKYLYEIEKEDFYYSFDQIW